MEGNPDIPRILFTEECPNNSNEAVELKEEQEKVHLVQYAFYSFIPQIISYNITLKTKDIIQPKSNTFKLHCIQ